MSDDRRGVTAIVFVGSVFSPRYARARRTGSADPLDFCAINIAVYGGPDLWVMSEWPRQAVERSADRIDVGGSVLSRTHDGLSMLIDERTAPFGRRVVGTLRLRSEVGGGDPIALDRWGRHLWWPAAPVARFDLQLSSHDLRLSGVAYHDANTGSEPLGAAFESWSWSRTAEPRGTSVVYDIDRRDGSRLWLSRNFGDTRAPKVADEPLALSSTTWRMPRRVRGPRGWRARVVRTCEDTPFYSRSILELEGESRRTLAVHESLDLNRFHRRWVQFLLPFRIRRRR